MDILRDKGGSSRSDALEHSARNPSSYDTRGWLFPDREGFCPVYCSFLHREQGDKLWLDTGQEEDGRQRNPV